MKNEDSAQEVPIEVSDNKDGTFTVDYVAHNPGLHTCTVLYGGQKVPSTPIKFKVIPSVDVSKIKVDGLEPSKYFVFYIGVHNRLIIFC